jgi:hypothetical protein
VNTILKVTFEDLRDEVVKPMPKGSVIRFVGEQRGRITLWFETDFDLMDRTDKDDVLESRRFFVVGTGHPIPEGATYLGTVPMASFVWHIFERVSA